MKLVATHLAEAIGFWYYSIDALKLLPKNWRSDILDVAAKHAIEKDIIPTSVTSREADPTKKIPVMVVGGSKLVTEVPWLDELYRGKFLDIANAICSEEVFPAKDVRYSLNLNIQTGTAMRYECHIDSNPVEALLYVTDNKPGMGGELIVSRRLDARNIDDVQENSISIYPAAGTLVVFDARKYAHYVAPLKNENDIRVVVAMNYYTPSCSENDRPKDLNRHLGLE